MNNTSYSIALPKPCNEDWDKMAPADRGRHCAACSKTVVDFSLMTDSQIVDVLRKAKGNTPCGHFATNQLDRVLTDTRYKPSFISTISKRIAATVLLLQSVSVASLAQQVRVKAASAYNQNAGKNAAKHIVRGRVIDVVSGKPMPGIKIKISAAGLETLTDNAGRFSLQLSPDTAKNAITIVGYPDYLTATQTDSFFIMEQVLTPAELAAGSEVVLYRYPVEVLPEHKVATYARPLISQYRHQGIMTTTEIKRMPVTYRYGLWYRITHPFRKRVRFNKEE